MSKRETNSQNLDLKQNESSCVSFREFRQEPSNVMREFLY